MRSTVIPGKENPCETFLGKVPNKFQAGFRECGRLSWESAVLSMLYRELCRAMESDKMSIGGCLLLCSHGLGGDCHFYVPCERPIHVPICDKAELCGTTQAARRYHTTRKQFLLGLKMKESGGDDGFRGDEISLLAKELIQLPVKNLMVEPNEKPTLLCTIWIEKSYNLDSFWAQMKSIWKMRKKLEIQLAWQNLFLIVFEIEEDLEIVMEGQPWLFRKKLVLFDWLTKPMERSQIQLNSSPFWIKIGPCFPEFDKKDLLHATGVAFRGVLRSEINGEFYRLKIQLDVQKPLRRGIFISIDNQRKSWISFKYEKLPMYGPKFVLAQ
ncbi:hypothetical protein CXB51_002841 [Gossypium anomalum]|uniref:DUF4283 domain-containing protein n=1 Tax=Gossypium anomalum TaxID=47600 RepID=A0A8J6DB53_9ROSI|nr:hypothetical protein CXB51_002841 [Gossypium anomalum]